MTDEDLVVVYDEVYEDVEDDSWDARIAHRAALRSVYERGRADDLATIRKDCSVDDNGDPVGAKPNSDWEEGYCAGIRTVYRTLQRAAPLASEAKP